MAVQKFLSFRLFTLIFALAILGETASTSSADVTLTPVALSREKFTAQGQKLRVGSFGAPAINLRNALVYYATCYGSGINASNNAFLGRISKSGKSRRIIARKGSVTSVGTLTGLSTNPYINNSFLVSWSAVFTTIVLDGQTQNITTNTYFLQTSKQGASARYFLFPDQDIVDKSMDLNKQNAITLLAGDLARPDAPQSVFRLQPGAATPLVAVGETAIGLPLGATYTEFGEPTIADNNTVFFAAKVSDTDTKFDGIWYGKNGDPNPLVVNGQTAPGVGALTAVSDPPVPSSSGKLAAFAATGGSGSGIFVVDVATGVITLTAKTGQSVSDYAQQLSGLQPPAVNNKGQVAFGVKTDGAALASANIERVNALFFVNPSEDPIKIIANGDTVVVKGKEKKVIDLRFAPTRGLNDLGYIAFTASFSDRTSGVFLAKP